MVQEKNSSAARGPRYQGSLFSRLAKWVSRGAGHPVTFTLALAVIIVWGITGPLFGFSDTWQLVINTGTTIVTFLMVFLIQNSQNRDSQAMQLKLDELIRSTEGAHNAMLDLEELTESDLDAFRKRYGSLAEKARRDVARGLRDTGHEEVDGSQPGMRKNPPEAAAQSEGDGYSWTMTGERREHGK